MSETLTRPVPAGVDTLSADESALLDQMRADDGADLAAAELPPVDEPAATELPLADDADEAPAGDERTKTVPHQALHQEREKRRAAEQKAREAEQKAAVEMARVQERLQLLTQAVTAATTPPPAATAEPEIPDVNVDPVGHFRAVSERLQKQLDQVQSTQQGFQQQAQQQAAVSELRNWAVAQEQAFMAQEPAYNTAMDALRAGRDAELEAIGITDPAERARVINNDITAIAVKARQDGASFPARLFALAKSRGWQPAPVVPALDAAPVAPVADRREAGRANSMTIGSAGAAPPPALTAEKIAAMPEAEFARYIEKVRGNPGALRSLLGA